MIEWGLSHLCNVELSSTHLIALQSVFAQSILKNQTNKIAVRLSLLGKILREFQSDVEEIWIQGKTGIVISHPVFVQMFEDTENIIRLENEQGSLFVSSEYCREIQDSVESLAIEHVQTFLTGFAYMPVELAGDLLCSSFGSKIIDIFVKNFKENKMDIQEKSKQISNFLKIRDILQGMDMQVSQKQTVLKGEILKNKQLFDQAGRNKINLISKLKTF